MTHPKPLPTCCAAHRLSAPQRQALAWMAQHGRAAYSGVSLCFTGRNYSVLPSTMAALERRGLVVAPAGTIGIREITEAGRAVLDAMEAKV